MTRNTPENPAAGKVRPIIFSAPMVRALLAGRKTQTRRLATSPLRRCEAGDQLYVRENWNAEQYAVEDAGPNYSGVQPFAAVFRGEPALKWKPSIHMPRWASRLTLIVEQVRVEPLQAINDADAEAEGVENKRRPRVGFSLLWNGLHTKPGERWEDNPHVVALTFRVEHRNVDATPTEPVK